MKRFLLLCLSTLLSVATWAYAFQEGGIYYNIVSATDLTVEVTYETTSYDSYTGKVVIPETVTFGDEEYTVTGIGQSAFRASSGLTEVTIPNTVTSFGTYTFQDCSSLDNVSLPDGLTAIPDYAFRNCSSLSSITIGENVTSIGASVFRECTGLASVTFAEGSKLESLGNYAFQECSKLTEVEVPNSVTSMGTYGFCKCTALEKAKIGEGMTSIPNYTFSECSSLVEVELSSEVASFGTRVFEKCTGLTSYEIPATVTSIGNYCFTGSGLKEITILSTVESLGTYMFDACESLEKAVMEEGFTAVNTYMFRNCTSLTDVTIPEGVTSLSNYMFFGCTALKSLKIPSSVTSYGTYLFQNCTGLEELPLGENVETIGNYDFYACSGLTSVEIPNNVSSLGTYVFYNCTGLKEATIGNKVPSIGSNAFYGCSALETLSLGSRVGSIAANAFNGCSQLSSLTSQNATPPTVANTNAFSDVPTSTCVLYVPKEAVEDYKADTYWSVFTNVEGIEVEEGAPLEDGDVFEYNGIKYEVISGANGTVEVTYSGSSNNSTTTYAGEIDIPSSIVYNGNTYTVIGVGAYAFYNAKENITSIKLPDAATYLGDYSLYYCSGMSSLSIPEKVTSIGGHALYDCTGLKELSIPNAVTSLGEYAIGYCTGLEKAVIGSGVSEAPTYMLYNCTSLTDVTLPENMTSIGSYAFCQCSALESISLPSALTTIDEYAFSKCSKLAKVEFAEAVNSIGRYAFNECSALDNVTVPAKITDLPVAMFYKCTGLKDVTLPSGLQTIGENAFYGCSALETVEIPESVTFIDEAVFRTCSALKSINIPTGVTTISDNTFYSCSSLTDVEWHDNITSLGSSAFRSCSALEEIELPKNLASMGSSVFNSCSSLKEITIPDGVTLIDEMAFWSCSELKTVNFPKEITSMNNRSFYQCYALEEVTLPEKLDSLGKDVFSECNLLVKVHAQDPTPAACGTTPFDNIGEECVLYVPFGSYEAYSTANVWKDFYSIEEAVAEDGDKFEVGGIYYTIVSAEDKTVEVTYYGDSYSADEAIAYYTGNINIPASFEYQGATYTVIGVGDYAFYKSGVESISFDTPSNVTYIGYRAIYNSTTITELTLPEGVLTVGDQALRQCTSMTTLNLPETVTYLGEYLCWGNTALKAINIPSSVTTLGRYVFYNCSAATELTLSPNITEWGGHAFYDCASLTSVVIPEGITEVGEYAFGNCDELVSVSIPNEVTTLGAHTFAACPKLESCVLPESMTEVDGYLFYNCPGMTEVTIGSKVESFGASVFAGCPGLTEIYSLNPTPPTIPSSTFSDSTTKTGTTNTETCVLYVPCGSEEDYASADNWSAFSNIVGYDCPEPVTFDYTLDPPEGEVSSLHSISLTYEDGVQLNAKESQWGNAKVYDANGDEVVEVIIATPIGTYGQTYTGYSFTIGLDGSSQDVTDAGDYYFVIPEGYLSFYDSTNDAWVECEQIIAHYVIEGKGDTGGTEAPYTVEPAEGTVESLSYVKFIDEGAICYTEEVDPSEVKVYKDGDMTSAVAYGVSVDDDHTSGAWDDAVKVTFNTTLTVEGEYTVVVPAGLFNIGSWTVVNDEIVLNYTVDGSANTGTFVCDVDPADGAKVTKLDQLVFTNPSGGEIFVNEEIRDLEINVYDEGNELVTKVTNFYTDFGDNWEEWAQIAMFGGSDDEGNVYPSEITAEGTYYVSVPANVFFIYDEGGNLCYNESMSLTYIISADADTENPDYTLSFNPEDGSTLDVLSAISIYCEDGITQVLMPDEDITITDAENNSWSGSYTITEVANDLGIVTEVVITLSPEIVEAGTYYVNVPSGYFDINQRMNEAFTLTYTITGTYTGISGISINDENVEGIYSVGGQKLNSTVKGVNIIRFSDGSVKKIYVK